MILEKFLLVYLLLDDPTIRPLRQKVIATFTSSTNDAPYIVQRNFLHSNVNNNKADKYTPV